MKPAIQWFEELKVPFDGDITIQDIIRIQEDAHLEGLKRAVEIVSLRIATPKNKSFTAAIDEAKVFLGAEIERGGKPAYCVCTTPQNKDVK